MSLHINFIIYAGDTDQDTQIEQSTTLIEQLCYDSYPHLHQTSLYDYSTLPGQLP